ncbi:SAV_915 family protein [Millisia brevis]|uniref:SAV_915 family protein n=1 Tax=Millisia brevis TaxID=264148 RepID=UPI000835109C|nr:SAV_915 family protein [Millisia brevis]
MSDQLTYVEPERIPPVLYVPCVDHVGAIEDAQFSYRETRDGRLAFLAYTSLDRLHNGLGDEQPWVLMPLAAINAQYVHRPWDLTMLDLNVPRNRRPEWSS